MHLAYLYNVLARFFFNIIYNYMTRKSVHLSIVIVQYSVQLFSRPISKAPDL